MKYAINLCKIICDLNQISCIDARNPRFPHFYFEFIRTFAYPIDIRVRTLFFFVLKNIPSKTTTTHCTLTLTILHLILEARRVLFAFKANVVQKIPSHTSTSKWKELILNWNRIESVSLINWCHGRKNVFVCSSSFFSSFLLFEKWKIKNMSKNKTTIWTVEHKECLKNFQGF